MDAERYQRIKTVFFAAVERPPEERTAWLDRECSGDAELRREVERLLESQAISTGEIAVPATDATPATVGPYAVTEEIGRGGMGVVYAADPPDGSATVAVKVVHPWLLLSPKAAERFAREARAGMAVKSENVVRTLDVGRDGDVHYLVMEHVSGRNLRGLLEELPTVPEALLRRIAEQVAAGLVGIHEAGIVHRDLKPENILISRDHRVRIMDLGVAKLSEATLELTQRGQFIGSLAYAAPEQCEGHEVGPEADLYSLGVVLAELATGANAFRAETPAAIIRAHLTLPPPPLPDLSPFFAEVIRTLLAKRAGERFSGSRQLMEVLTEGESGGWWATRKRSMRTGDRPDVPVARAAALVGREREMEALANAWRDAREGRGGAVLLTGEPGLGKTRLIDAFLEEHAGTAQVLYGAYEVSGGFSGLVSAVTGRFGAAGLGDALAAYLPDSPVLADAFAAFLARESEMAGDALQATVTRLLGSLSEERETIWITEDLHLAPEVGRAVALAMARAAPNHRTLVVLSAREPVLPSEVTTLPLERLAPAEVRRLVRSARPEAGSVTIDRIVKKAEGVPWFALELLRTLEATGDLSEVPSAVRDVLAARLGDLSRTERALLDVAAVMGVEFDADLTADALGLPVVTVLQDLAELERRTGIIRAAGRLYRFDHHQIRDLILAELPDRLREEYHTRLAIAGDERGAPDRFRALHFLSGRSPERGLAPMHAAIKSPEMHFLHREAVQLMDLALGCEGLVTGRERADLLLSNAWRLDSLARRPEQAAANEEALAIAEEIGDPALRARVEIAMGRHHVSVSEEEKALARYRAALALAHEAEDAELITEAQSLCGVILARLRQDREALAVHESCRESAKTQGNTGQLILSTINVSVALRHLGRYRDALDELTAVMPIAEEHGDMRLLGHVAGNTGMLHWHLGEMEDARAMLTRQLELARASGFRRSELAATGNLGLAYRELGRAGDAFASFSRHRAFAKEIGDRRAALVSDLNLGRTLAEFGDFKAAKCHLEDPLTMGEEIDAPHMAPSAHLSLAEVARMEERPEEEREHFEKALELLRKMDDPAGKAEALVGLGQYEEGLALATRLDLPTVLLRAAAQRGDEEEAGRILAEAGDRIGVPARLEGYYLLWRATGGEEHFVAARSLLTDLVASSPEEFRASMVERVPRHRALFS